jgi:hypothetical protein
MIQVSNCGSGYTVLVDGVAHGHYSSRHVAIKVATDLKEQQDPVRLGS